MNQIKTVQSPIGEIQYDETNIIAFPRGLVGFAKMKRFIVVTEDVLSFLISLDEPSFTLPIMKCSYRIHDRIKTESLTELDTTEMSNIDVYVIVTIAKDDFENSTANPNTPLLICQKTKNGKQAILLSSHLKDFKIFKENADVGTNETQGGFHKNR